MRIDVRTLWMITEAFAKGDASVETAKEAQVGASTSWGSAGDRVWFRVLRADSQDAEN